MNKGKILLVMATALLFTGCFGSSDLEIENRELKRQVDTLHSRMEFLQGEVDRLSGGKKSIIEEGTGSDAVLEDDDQLICGGIAGFLCPDAYLCLDKDENIPDATGVCVPVDGVEEYRAKQVASGKSQTTSGQSTDASAENSDSSGCGVLGEKINRNPLLGATSKNCCATLVEDRVSKSYSICREAGAVVESEEVSSEEVAPEELGPTCASEGEGPEDGDPSDCCTGLKLMNAVCIADDGYREPPVEGSSSGGEEIGSTSEGRGFNSTLPDYTIGGYMTYSTDIGGFSISYPQYWYWGGYGSTSDALWMAGFGPSELEDDASNVVITVNLKNGAPSKRSWPAGDMSYCTASLDSHHYIEVRGSITLGDVLCTMADSAVLVED